MPELLFRLNGVPEDEAEEVRELLRSAHVDFYETEQGRWGVSLAAIWLRDDSQLERARELIDSYQDQRSREARADYQRRLEAGEVESQLERLRRDPLRVILFVAIILVILYFTIMPFYKLAAP